MMSNIEEYIKLYSYLVEYSLKDEAYLAKCIELGIMAHGETQEEAILEIKEATRVHVLMLKEDGDKIPEPFNLREFSGKLNLRMTPEKHREIALKARTQGVSLNHYINSQLK